MGILIFNAGSSSLKFGLFDKGEILSVEGSIDWAGKETRIEIKGGKRNKTLHEVKLATQGEAVAHILEAVIEDHFPDLNRVRAVGHRVVHGGRRFRSAARITPDVKSAIEELSKLAPLHNPASLEVIEAVEQALPDVPQVAVFDTAFFASLPPCALTYPVPMKWTREWGIRRFGFHGLSHAYCAARAAELLERDDLRLVIAHLGHGASMSAVLKGVCIDTSMGFTPLEGLMMGTRSGTIDPGLMIYLLRDKKLTVEQLDNDLNYQSGLLGVSGFSSDMRQILAAASRHPDAQLARDTYVHRARRTIGAMAASLGGIDALVFTAGIGENSAEIRSLICQNMEYMGLKADLEANRKGVPDRDIAALDSSGRILVIATREDLTILRETRNVLERLSALPLP